MARSAAILLALSALAGCAADPVHDTFSTTPAVTPTVTGAIVTVPAVAAAPAGTIVATPGTVVTAPAIVPAAPVIATTFRSGSGLIDSVQLVRAAPSASAGASANEQVMAYRLVVRMDDGSVQTIDQDSRLFRAGDRIHITSDGRVALL